jgi:hypothetical protein
MKLPELGISRAFMSLAIGLSALVATPPLTQSSLPLLK